MVGTRPTRGFGVPAEGSRCAQLRGEIGAAVHCGMYEKRPEPCRRFAFSWQHGEAHPECDAVRASLGLAPLSTPKGVETGAAIRYGGVDAGGGASVSI
jgi:Fe-S-cluster containining protein